MPPSPAARAARVAADVEVLVAHVHAARGAVVVVVCDAPDATDAERRLARGALHAALLDEFAADGLDVAVLAPPPRRVGASPRELVPFALGVYRAAVRAYPWRRAAAMAASVPMLVSDALERAARGVRDPVLDGVVDRCLPPPTDAALLAAAEVAAQRGAWPATLLDLYEAAFHLRAAGRAGPRTAALADQLFA
jgi:hypothetical protein